MGQEATATHEGTPGITQLDTIASQRGPVQVVKLESGDNLKHILLALIVAMALSVPLSVVAIFMASQAQHAAEAAQAHVDLDTYFKQRVIQELRDKHMQAD